jgi:hypothetical protein
MQDEVAGSGFDNNAAPGAAMGKQSGAGAPGAGPGAGPATHNSSSGAGAAAAAGVQHVPGAKGVGRDVVEGLDWKWLDGFRRSQRFGPVRSVVVGWGCTS